MKFAVVLSLLVALAFGQTDNTNQRPYILVTGQGVVTVPTTIAQITLGVIAQAPTAVEAQSQVATQASSVVAFLQSENVTNLQTVSIFLNPQTSPNGTITSYIAGNLISFEAPVAQAGTLIDQAVTFGATTVQDVSLVPSNESLAAAREQAVTLAIRDARRLADIAAGEAGLTAGEILSIEILSVFNPGPQPLLRAAEFSTSTPVVGGQQDVTARVSVKIAIS